jgi:hypothetical protein
LGVSNVVNVKLAPSSQALEEVVVGYGTQKKGKRLSVSLVKW